MSKPRILFVDDEVNLLQSLKRLLRPYRHQWDMLFASNGMEALDMLAGCGIDVVVSDMRMPEMDGAQLLQRLKAQSPHSIRLILSGQADKSTARDCIGLSHQFLSKPNDATAMIAFIEGILEISARLPFPVLKSLAAMAALPTRDERAQQLKRHAREGGFSLLKMAQIVDGDLALSAKILQVANSAYFGCGEMVAAPEAAVQMLDADEMRRLQQHPGFINVLDEDAPWASAYLQECDDTIARADAADVKERQTAKFKRLGHAALIATGHDADEELGELATEFLIRLWGLPLVLNTAKTKNIGVA